MKNLVIRQAILFGQPISGIARLQKLTLWEGGLLS
jgi:hypothetical protein